MHSTFPQVKNRLVPKEKFRFKSRQRRAEAKAKAAAEVAANGTGVGDEKNFEKEEGKQGLEDVLADLAREQPVITIDGHEGPAARVRVMADVSTYASHERTPEHAHNFGFAGLLGGVLCSSACVSSL